MIIWMSRLGLGLIAVYCSLASVFFSSFAEIHIHIGNFPVPVFIGEILLAACALLWAGLIVLERKPVNNLGMVLILYFVWVVVKALINYAGDGSLALRHAALFYYSTFAVFAYFFSFRAQMPRWVLTGFALAAGVVLLAGQEVYWYWWTYQAALILFIGSVRRVALRWIVVILLAGCILLRFESFYIGARAHLAGIFCAAVFLAGYLAVFLFRQRRMIALFAVMIVLVIFLGGFLVFSNHNALASLAKFQRVADVFVGYDKMCREVTADYVPSKLTVHIYNPDKTEDMVSPLLQLMAQKKNFADDRPLAINQNNIVFRLLVWRDMWRELVAEKPIFGFSFGRPQRSKSLEILHWAEGEWSRDGWIAPHNSFLHMIYRGGIIGLAAVLFILFSLAWMTRDFLRALSWRGGVLVSTLIYWIVNAQFGVILEFPYNAILFWTLFGCTWAYRDKLMAEFSRAHDGA